MALFVRLSILKRFLVVVSCTFLVCLPRHKVWAQHPIGSAAPHARAAAHVPVVPISHPQVFQPPVIRSPILYAPAPASRIPTSQPLGILARPIPWSPRRPIHPLPPLVFFYSPQFFFGGPWWGLGPCWSASCDLFWPGTFSYSTVSSVSSPGPIVNVSQVYENPVYVYGAERPERPQVYLKDGAILNVTDYWLVDDELHVKMIEEDGAKPAEQVIPFDEVDLQKTVDASTRRGFRFVLRNEPLDRYLRDHSEDLPPVVTLPHN
jgi:hypothetical protein